MAAKSTQIITFFITVLNHDPKQQHAPKWCPGVDKSKAIATLLSDQASDIVTRLYTVPNIEMRLNIYTLHVIYFQISDTTLIGFVGTPWTHAAYAMEGKAEKNCKVLKVQTAANRDCVLANISVRSSFQKPIICIKKKIYLSDQSVPRNFYSILKTITMAASSAIIAANYSTSNPLIRKQWAV